MAYPLVRPVIVYRGVRWCHGRRCTAHAAHSTLNRILDGGHITEDHDTAIYEGFISEVPSFDLFLLALPRRRRHEITSLSGVMMVLIYAGLGDMGVQPIVHLSNRAFFGLEFLKRATVWDQLKRTDFTGHPFSLCGPVTHTYPLQHNPEIDSTSVAM
jgi:hypothetical protein